MNDISVNSDGTLIACGDDNGSIYVLRVCQVSDDILSFDDPDQHTHASNANSSVRYVPDLYKTFKGTHSNICMSLGFLSPFLSSSQRKQLSVRETRREFLISGGLDAICANPASTRVYGRRMLRLWSKIHQVRRTLRQ